jgi:hypothetical protein
MGGLLSECCDVEDVEWIALVSAERVVVGADCHIPLCSRKQTSVSVIPMSALGQNQTHAPQQSGRSFDHFVGAK